MNDPFLQALGAAADDLPPPLRQFHTGTDRREFVGRCDVTTGRGPVAWLLRWLGGFPGTGRDLPIRIAVKPVDGAWLWRRDFAGHVTRSRLEFDATTGLVVERFGPIKLGLSVTAEPGGFAVEPRRASIVGLPLPRMLSPRGVSREYQDDQGRMCFDISARLPALGLLIRYAGYLLASPN